MVLQPATAAACMLVMWQCSCPLPHSHLGAQTSPRLLHTLLPCSYNSIIPEPNNLENPPELCAGGNFSQAFGDRNVSGWADANCSIAAPFICKMMSDLVR